VSLACVRATEQRPRVWQGKSGRGFEQQQMSCCLQQRCGCIMSLVLLLVLWNLHWCCCIRCR